MSKKHLLRYLKDDEFALWDNFINECESGLVFHGTKHLESLAIALKLKFSILGVFDADQQLLAGMAFVHNTRFGISNIYLPPITPFYSPIIKPPNKKYLSKIESYKHALVNSIVEELSKKYKIINLTLPPDEIDIRPYKWMGFETEVLYTYCTTLNEQTSIATDYDPDIKRRIKNAQTLKFEISQGTSKEFIDNFFELQLKSYHRQSFSFAFNSSQFEKYLSGMGLEGKAMIYLVSQNNVPVSGITILYDNIKAYYLLAGSDPDYLSTGLNQVLFDFVVQDIQKKGIKIYDLVGANTPSISRYKSTYNFPLVPYYHVFKIFGLKAKLLMKIKTIYERIRK